MIDCSELDEAFRKCLYEDHEIVEGKIPTDAVIVEGVINKFGFHPQRLEATRDKVIGWLKQLPLQFREDGPIGGGGWSFLQACMTADGNQWGEHMNMEQLFCLGMGLKLVKCGLPRDVWKTLPGGMPYYSISKQVYEPVNQTQPTETKS